MTIKEWALRFVPASWWAWRVWRYVNPVHFVLAVPYAAVFQHCGMLSVNAQLLVIGVTHELGDDDFDPALVPTAPWEGIKDAYSFVLGGLAYYAARALW